MVTTKDQFISLAQVAMGFGISRGRVSQLKKKDPEFPRPRHRRGLTDYYDDNEIRSYATQSGRSYFSPLGKGESGDEFWKTPGSFSYRGVADINGVAWLVYDDDADRLAIRYHSPHQSPQRNPVVRNLRPTWTLEVKSTWMVSEPEVIAESTEYSDIDDRVLIGFSDVARKIGGRIPFLQRASNSLCTQLMLARDGDSPHELAPDHQMPNLDPAYRLFAHAEDADVRAAAGSFINAVHGSSRFTLESERKEIASNREIEVRGLVSTDRDVAYRGDPDAGFSKIVYGAPHEAFVSFIDAAKMWGAVGGTGEADPVISTEEMFGSGTAIDLVISTWEEVEPCAGHAYVLDSSDWQPESGPPRFFEHPATRDLAVVCSDRVRLTWRPRRDLEPTHLVFAEDVGIIALDQDGVATIPLPPQAFGYVSGNISTARRAAGLINVELSRDIKAIESTELFRRLNSETLELETPIDVNTIRAMLR